MGKSTLQAFALALSLFFAGCFDNKFATTEDKAYKFSFNGFEKRLSYGESKPYALAFFTKDCAVCAEQIRILNALQGRFELKFLAVLKDAQDKTEAKLWAQSKNLALPLFFEARASEFLARAVGGIYGVPVIVFVDEKGILGKKFIGLTPQSVLEKELANFNYLY